MRLTDVQIDRYGPLRGVREAPGNGITVVYGPNESGKTLFLDAVLKLLDPAVTGAYPQRIQRVDESPSGFVVVETDTRTTKLDGDATLADVSPIEARHLRNVFTVRDSDLSLADQHAFYDSLTEQIGDLHTSEIERIQDAFEDRGRLTTERRNVSSAAEYDHAKTVREKASDLSEEIAEYVTAAREEDLDATERERIQVERELRACREALETQERARIVHEHERLRDRLETYRDATETLEDRYEFTQEELETLTSLSETISSATEAIDDAEAEIASLEADVEEMESELASAERELAMLDRRADAVAETEAALAEYRDARENEGERDRWLRTTGRVALVGLGLGGAGTIAGALDGGIAFLALAVVLLGVGVLAAGAWAYSYRQAAAVANRRTALREQARDAGFDVETVSEIPPAIQHYRDERDELESRIDDLERDVEVAERRTADHEATISDARDRLQASRDETRELLRAADVDDVDAYRSALDATSEVETEWSNARQSLADALGEPDVVDPDPTTLIEYWEKELETVVADVDVDAVDPDEFDDDRLADLRDRETELEERKADLEATLEAHESTIQEFRNRARELRCEPFRDDPLALTAETIDGLEQLRIDLNALADRITRDAEISRIGLAIFDDIHDEEEEKITDLFDTNGRATDVFATFTDDRYTDVTYDTDAQQLVVETHDGTRHTPDELSHGTRDQLHFATRVSLAEQLLGTESGFLILDDAFLPADPTRLEHGFDILQDLAANDWQIIYLTAKREIGERLVDDRDLERIDLEPLP